MAGLEAERTLFSNVVGVVRRLACLPDDMDSIERADLALGNALVGAIQVYLAEASDQWDVDLFFDTYGRPPRDGGIWSEPIIEGLRFRTDVSVDDRQRIINVSIDSAVRFLTGSR